MQVFNNLIVRDRFDAYEIAARSGSGLRSSHNYYFEQVIEESPGFAGDENSIIGFRAADALAQFINPNFEPWILPDNAGYSLNPARPDYHLRPDSVLINNGHSAIDPQYDLFGAARGTEIGALTAG